MFPLTVNSRQRRRPSPRNLEIYDAVMLDGRTQLEVAAKHNLCQARISQIVASVEAWRVSTAAADRGELAPDQNQRKELWLAQQRNHELYRRSLRAFDDSTQSLTTTKTIREESLSRRERVARAPTRSVGRPPGEGDQDGEEVGSQRSEVRDADVGCISAAQCTPPTSDKQQVHCVPLMHPTKILRLETTVREQRANASFLRQAFAANKELARLAELPVKPEPKPEENFQKEYNEVNDWLWRQRRKRE